MKKRIRVNGNKSINYSNTFIKIFIMVLAVFFAATIETMSTGTTIAYIGDAEPKSTSGIQEFTKDLNQVLPLSPTGKVDAVFLMGDMETIPNTFQAVNASTIKDIPIYFVIGNYEAGSSTDTDLIKARYSKSPIPLTPGPTGTDKTTYSMNVDNLHIINMNEYWNGATDDSYGNGYIQDALYNWISNDLSGITTYKIVVGHDPLYPIGRHVGDSLDANTSNRDKLQALFVSKNVDIFIGGHTHNAGLQNIGGIFHGNSGTSGTGPNPAGYDSLGPEDTFASILYTHINDTGSLILTWKHENPTWDTPTATSYTISKVISTGGIVVTSPNGGETWVRGTTQTISWTYSGTTGSNVRIELMKGGVFDRTINSSTPVGISGSGSYNWLINSTQTPGTDYKVRITSTTNSSYNDTSDNNFTIDSSESSITVFYPNGGEILPRGTTQTIKWNYTGSPGSFVNITLLKGGVLNRTINSNVPIGSSGNGSYNWALSSTQAPAGDYKVRITSTTNAGYNDTSDNNFNILAIPSGYSYIYGKVINDSVGIADVFVITNTTISTTTDTSGFYSLLVPAGKYNLTVTKEPAYYKNSSVVVTTIAGTAVMKDIMLTRKLMGTISGTVRSV